MVTKYYTIENWTDYRETEQTEPNNMQVLTYKVSTVMANHPCIVTTYMDNTTGEGFETRVFAHYQE